MTENRRIRVMRIIARLNIGGPSIHVALLTQRLPADVYETRLVVGSLSADEGDMTYYARERNVEPVVVPELRREISPVNDFQVLQAMRRLIREYQPDVVHTHTAKAGFIGRLAARLEGVPVIVHTFHGHVFRGYFGPLKTRLFISLERMAARWADTIITLTNSLRRELVEDYGITSKGHITVLPLGLDLHPFVVAKRKSGKFLRGWNLPTDAPIIGHVGRMAPVKNQRLYFDAAKLVLEQKPDAHVVLIGEGEDSEMLHSYVKEIGIADRVTFTGWQKDTAAVYADLDVKVISSRNEGTPVTLIEALAAGCPVVSTDVGGVRELLDGGVFGRLVPDGDARAMADAILETLDNPPAPETAREAMINRYGIDRLVRDIDGLYRGLLTKKNVNPHTEP
ncbi:MAG: glycosyltransferase family 4 protein [Chloroflexota bacterium]